MLVMTHKFVKYPHDRRRRLRIVRSLVCSLCLGALVLGLEVASASGEAKAHMVTGTTVIVSLGKPDDHTIWLSKDQVAKGRVTFKVTNKGKKKHNFQICSAPANSAVANSCVGLDTKVLAPGMSATLTVTLQVGIYEYLSSVPGDAKAGMKGGLDVILPPPPAPPVETVTQAPCAKPVTTNVAVNEFDYGITLTPNTVPCGTVLFDIVNSSDSSLHNFSIVRAGTARAASNDLAPADSGTLKVVLGPGDHAYQSDDPGDAPQGMAGTLKVTG
jgi:uncharacterized cupredoxin-like copper-binding protein